MLQPQQKRKMLGEMLILEGVLTREQLGHALAEQKRHGGRVGSILRGLNYVTEEEIIKVLAKQMGIPHLALNAAIIDTDAIKLVPETIARRHQVIPLFKKANALTLAMADPLNVFAIDEIHQIAGCEISPVVATEQEILRAIDRYYGGTGPMQDALREAKQQGIGVLKEVEQDTRSLGEETPVVKFVNTLLGQAVKEGASDIHLEPDGEVIRIRYRVDGLLRDVMNAPKTLQSGIISRIKIMASLDISEKRVPQDGRIEMKVGDKEIDIRLSTLPTIFGEKIVVRLLDKGSVLIGPEDLGLATETLKLFEKIIRRPHGMVLVTGATGSGKTTTLYAALQTINSPEKNIVTIEDPVEYHLKGITQVQVNTKAGVNFVTGLRSILRQDPDVVMVGEIRDRETATIAVQAALTGHLVLSTLHTNDSNGAVARLIDMGVEPFLVASSLSAVLAQKLVRRICKGCKVSYTPSPEFLKNLRVPNLLDGMKTLSLARGKGCQQCRGSGYAGRVGIFEFLPIDDAIRNLIVSRAPSAEIRKAAVLAGLRPLRVEGIVRAFQGVTSLEEVLRVTQDIEE